MGINVDVNRMLQSIRQALYTTMTGDPVNQTLVRACEVLNKREGSRDKDTCSSHSLGAQARLTAQQARILNSLEPSRPQ